MSRRLDWLLPSWLEDVDAYSQSINEDMISVFYTIVVNLCILVLCILFFSIYRMYNDQLYAPKSDMFPGRTPPKIPNNSLFGWAYDIFAIDDQLIIDKGGYDILFLIRFYRLGFKILLWTSVYCLFVLVPINGTGIETKDMTSFDRWSMTNIPQGSNKCWFHLLGIYIFTCITIYFLEREYVIYAKYRHIFLRQTHAHLRTVLVEGIPNKFRSPATLAAYFEVLYPGAILHVKLVQNLKYLDTLVAQRDVVVAELERHLYANHNNHQRPTVSVGNMLQPVDAIRHFSQLLDDLNTSIAREQKVARSLTVYEDKTRVRGPDGSQSQSAISDIVDEFLKVTEINAVRKTFKDSKAIGEDAVISTVAAAAAARRSTMMDEPFDFLDGEEDYISSYQRGGSAGGVEKNDLKAAMSRNRDAFDIESDDGEDCNCSGGPNGANARLFRTYKLSFKEWLWEIWTAPSFVQGWQKVQNGRDAEVEYSNGFCDEEAGSALISPPEERRLFLSKAFVTFKTFTAATTARQVVHMQLAGRMTISEAPEPTDVTWSNLYTTRKGVLLRRFVVEFAVLFLIVIWIAPVTLLSFIFSKDALSGFFPWVAVWCDKSMIFLSIVELLQPLALVAIMNLLPPILTFLAILEGCTAFSVNQMRSYNRYFTFQIINVFLVTTIAGSVVDVVEELYKDPSAGFELLGTSLPKLGGFFTNYILVKALTGLGMELMRFPALFSASIKQLFTSNVTPRDRNATPLFGAVRNPSNPGWFPFAKIYAQDMLLFVVSATYSCISPLILVAGMMYFAGAAYVYKHQMLYVYEPIFETGGKWWPKMARCFVVALLFAQATMVGMLILKETYLEIYAMILIVGITSSYYWYVASIYEPLANQLPLDMAMAMDRQLAALGDDEHARQLRLDGADDYLQPAIRAPPLRPNVEFPLNDKTDLVNV